MTPEPEERRPRRGGAAESRQLPVTPTSLPPAVYVEEVPSGARAIAAAPTSVTGFVGRADDGPTGEPTPVASWDDFRQTFVAGLTTGLAVAVRDYFRHGGRSAVVLRLGAPGTTREADAYAAALSHLPDVNLLCLPPDVPGGSVPDDVWPVALGWCVHNRAFLLVDPPADVAVDEVADWADGLGLTDRPGRNAALYVPRLRPDDLPDDVAPSGAVAGVYARTDTTRGVWKAPAGTQTRLTGATPALPLLDAQIDRLNPRGVNAIRAFPGRGTVVWGARTLRGADVHGDEHKYVPVRRLALLVEESLSRGLQWAVFEPNDEPLWAQVRLVVTGFLQDLFRQGAFQGTTPREAYLVACGRSTMTQADIDDGWLVVQVGFAPLKPAEFVVLTLRQRTAGA